MWPYAVCFTVSCYFTKVATKYKNHDRKVEYVFFSVLAVILPCLLAAFRDSTVGTDVNVYGDITFYRSFQMDFNDYIISRNGEYLYLLVVYICSHIVRTTNFQYFILQALTIIPFYCTLQRSKENEYAWFGMIVYYLMLFPYSLNLMRQCIAIAIIFWGFKYVQERKLLKYLLVILIATMFHTTGVVGVLIYPIYILVTTNTDSLEESSWYNKHSNSFIVSIARKYGGFISCAIILVTIYVLTRFSKIISYLYMHNAEDYSHFYNQLNASNLSYIREYVILVLPIFVMYLFARRYYNSVDNDVLPTFTFSIMAIILYQAATISAETYRVSLYFHIFLPLFVMKLFYYKTKTKNRWLWMFIIFICLVLFWNHFFIGEEWCQIYPYTSEILGIN